MRAREEWCVENKILKKVNNIKAVEKYNKDWKVLDSVKYGSTIALPEKTSTAGG